MKLESLLEAYAGYEKRALALYRKLAERFEGNAQASRRWRQMSDAEARHFTTLQLASDWITMAGERTANLEMEPAALAALAAKLDQLAAAPRFDHEWGRLVPHTSVLVCPVSSNGHIIGGFAIVWVRETHRFTREELLLVEGIAQQAALAIENARLLQESRIRQTRLEALLEVARQLVRVQPLESLLTGIAETCGRLLGTDSVGFRLVDGDDLVVVGTCGDAKHIMTTPRLTMGESLSGLVAATGELLCISDPGNDPRLIPAHRAAIQKLGYRRVLVVPVKVGARVVGVLSIHAKREDAFSPDDLAIVTAFASYAASALENARLLRDLQKALDDLKAAQNQLVRAETVRAVEELGSGMAHHLNNLLTVTLGQVQLLLGRVRAPDVGRPLEIIERATLGAAEIVRRVQGFARATPVGRVGPVPLNELAREVVELTQVWWQVEADVRGIRIETALELGDIPAVAGDPVDFREVLTNLLLNAIDALAEGGRITIRTWASGERVYCAVTDNGVGMSEEVRRRALEPFFTTKGPKSTGLGLSVSYGIVQGHGGDLRIESTPGRGTTITISLPISAAACQPRSGPSPVW